MALDMGDDFFSTIMDNLSGNEKPGGGAGSNSTEDIMTAVGMTNSKLKESSKAVQDIIAEQKQAQEDELVAKRRQGENSQIVLKAKEIADLNAQQSAQREATALGTNPDESTEIITKLSKQWVAATENAIAKKQDLEDNLSVKFTEHPLTWLGNQFALEGTAQAADAAASKQQLIQNALINSQSLTQSFVVTANALKSTKTAATVQATLEGAQATIDENVAQTKLRNAGINIQGIQALDSISLQQLNALSIGSNVKNQAAQLDIAKQHLKIAQTSMEAAIADRLDRKEIRDADRADNESLAGMVRKGMSIAGFSDAAIQVPTNKVIQMLRMTKDDKEAPYQKYLRMGMMSDSMNHPVVSENAGQSAALVALNGAPLQPTQESIRNFLKDTWNTTAAGDMSIVGPNGKRYDYNNKKVSEVIEATNIKAGAEALKQMGNIKAGDNTNIYAPPPLDSVLDLPAIKNSELYKKVFQPQQAAGGLKEFKPDQLVGLTVQAIRNGTISFRDGADGLQGMFSAVPAINNRTKNYIGLGLPMQTGYKTAINTSLASSRTFDLSTGNDINSILSQELRALNMAPTLFPSAWEK